MPIGPLPRTFNCTALQGGETVNNYYPVGFNQRNSSAKAVFNNLHIFLHALKGMAIEFDVRHCRSVFLFGIAAYFFPVGTAGQTVEITPSQGCQPLKGWQPLAACLIKQVVVTHSIRSSAHPIGKK